MQVGRGDHEQRRAVDAMVVEPVADQRAALERRRLDVVDRDGDAPLAGTARDSVGGDHAASRAAAAAGASARLQPAARPASDASHVRSRTAASPPRASRSRIAREPARPATAPPSASARGAHSSPLRPSAISSAGPPAADRDHRQARRLGLEHDLAERVGRRAEQEDVRRGVGRGQLVAVEPAEERRRPPEPPTQPLLLGPAAGEHQVQPAVTRTRCEEGVGEQVGALLARQPAGVEDVDAIGSEAVGFAPRRREALRVDAAVPARDPRRRESPSPARLASDAEEGDRTTPHWP